MLKLRRATMDDARLLFDWRNDPTTRSASHNTAELSFPDHVSWFKMSLESPSRQIYIAEMDGTAVGTVRADISDSVTELSWTVAPEWRGNGIGTKMVNLLASQIDGTIRAEVKIGNIASERIALAAGMNKLKEENGISHFSNESASLAQ